MRPKGTSVPNSLTIFSALRTGVKHPGEVARRFYTPRWPGTRRWRGGAHFGALGFGVERHSAWFNPRKRSNRFARQMARIKKNQTVTVPRIAAMMNQGFTRTPK